MSSPIGPEDLEAHLAAACSVLNDAAGIQKDVAVPPGKEILLKIAEALACCWEAREKIHAYRPDLVPSFVVEHEKSPEIYGQFISLCSRAHQLESAGDLAATLAEYDAFVASTPSGYCRRVIQLRSNLLRLSPNNSFKADASGAA
ncbi:hypothetical protein [Rhodanobacter hydrolyticus]|uniref:Uncharacterized protein n=1 Tax=Rhodanobacter hydrolyticus TaxID=2250595 RepID=A0ABW8J6K1_9GAMM